MVCFNPFQGCRCVVISTRFCRIGAISEFQSLSGLSLCCDHYYWNGSDDGWRRFQSLSGLSLCCDLMTLAVSTSFAQFQSLSGLSLCCDGW